MHTARGAVEACTSCPIEIECTMIRTRAANKCFLALTNGSSYNMPFCCFFVFKLSMTEI